MPVTPEKSLSLLHTHKEAMTSGTHTILLVDDEPDILDFISYNLRKEGYRVYSAIDGQEALRLAKKVHPHLIILDVMMPGMDGVETCRMIRQTPGLSDIIITFLTARGEDYSQLAGFDAGGDDYITKPIKPGLLISRVKALLRRYQPNSGSGSWQKLQVGDIGIDREEYVVWRKEDRIDLPRKEFELLCLLVSKPNKVFTRDEIFDKVWGNMVIVGDRTIDVHIRKLREKIGAGYIRTVKGVGYKFIPEPAIHDPE